MQLQVLELGLDDASSSTENWSPLAPVFAATSLSKFHLVPDIATATAAASPPPLPIPLADSASPSPSKARHGADRSARHLVLSSHAADRSLEGESFSEMRERSTGKNIAMEGYIFVFIVIRERR